VIDDYSSAFNYTYGSASQLPPTGGVVGLNSTNDGYGAGRTGLNLDLSSVLNENFELVVRRGTNTHNTNWLQLKIIDLEGQNRTVRFNVSSLPGPTDPFVTLVSVHTLNGAAFGNPIGSDPSDFNPDKITGYELQGTYGGLNSNSSTVSLQLDALQVVPEPASAMTLGVLGALGLIRRRRVS
jgi:MYXO-CTERM domain-containing protein